MIMTCEKSKKKKVTDKPSLRNHTTKHVSKFQQTHRKNKVRNASFRKKTAFLCWSSLYICINLRKNKDHRNSTPYDGIVEQISHRTSPMSPTTATVRPDFTAAAAAALTAAPFTPSKVPAGSAPVPAASASANNACEGVSILRWRSTFAAATAASTSAAIGPSARP